MLVKFNENNQSTTFIKSIVTATPLPIVDCLQDGDRIITDCSYIYHGKLIKCLVGGVLDRRLNDLEPGKAYVNRDGSRFAVLDDIDFGSYHLNVSRKETCPNSYYDSDTHRLLGKYLRMIRSYHRIDLMPLYNVFDGTLLDDIYVNVGDEYPIKLSYSSNSKVLFVPIKYNTGYTFYIDSKKPVQVCPIFRNEAGPFKLRVKRNFEAKSIFDEAYDENHYIYRDPEDEEKSIRTNYAGKFDPFVLHDIQFRKPIYWEGISCETKDLYELQNYLGLLIQLEKNNNSSVVVLEGDRLDERRLVFNSQNEAWLDQEETETNPPDPRPIIKKRGVKFLIDDLTPQQFNDLFRSRKQLTLINDKNIYAFNDKLIAYLVHHVITNMETIEKNIGRIQEYIPNRLEYEDIWDDRLRIDVYNKYMANFEIARFDTNGFIDADIEKFLFDNKDWLMK